MDMKILGYRPTYESGRELAREMGYAFAYVVSSNQAPHHFTVLVEA